MSEGTKQEVDTNSTDQEMKVEPKKKEPIDERHSEESSTPLFKSDGPRGNMANLQDEKDETEE